MKFEKNDKDKTEIKGWKVLLHSCSQIHNEYKILSKSRLRFYFLYVIIYRFYFLYLIIYRHSICNNIQILFSISNNIQTVTVNLKNKISTSTY